MSPEHILNPVIFKTLPRSAIPPLLNVVGAIYHELENIHAGQRPIVDKKPGTKRVRRGSLVIIQHELAKFINDRPLERFIPHTLMEAFPQHDYETIRDCLNAAWHRNLIEKVSGTGDYRAMAQFRNY